MDLVSGMTRQPAHDQRGLVGPIVIQSGRHTKPSPRASISNRTDGEVEWVIRAEGGQVVTEALHARADLAMRGSAEGLYWVEWFPGP
jgi:hypothetical protein